MTSNKKTKENRKIEYPKGFRFLFILIMPLWLIVGLEILLNIDTRRNTGDFAKMATQVDEAIRSLAIKDEILMNKIDVVDKRVDHMSTEMDLVLKTYLPKSKPGKSKGKLGSIFNDDDNGEEETSSVQLPDGDNVAQIPSFEKMAYENEIAVDELADVSDRTKILENEIMKVNEAIAAANNNNMSNSLILSSVRLRDAVNNSQDFSAELATLKLFAMDDERLLKQISILQKHADGISSIATLRQDFDLVAGQILNMNRKHKDQPTIIDQIAVQLSSLVQVRKVDANANGNSVDDILARSYNFLLKSDLSNAVKEVETLTEDSKVIAQPWLERAQAYLESVEASDAIFSYVTDISVTAG